jgi:frataxin-like iron-binding protein CyaY
VERAGGRVEINAKGIEEYIIPVQVPVLKPLEQCWEATEVLGDVHFTPEEKEKISVREPKTK